MTEEIETQEVEESTAEDVSPQSVPTPEKGKRIDIKLPATLRSVLGTLRQDEESDAAVVKRILESVPTLEGRIADLVSSNEHLQSVNGEIRETLEEELQRHTEIFGEQVMEIGELRARITTLENAAGTAVVPAGEQASLGSIGIKDVIEEAREICGDDDTCNSVIGKMIDLKAHFASKAVDHEHSAEQNRLDRDQKELDRESKADLAEKERKFKAEQAEKDQKNRIELALAKKGGFKSEFLEDVVFLSGGSPKQPKKEIERRKQHARHAADDEEEYLGPDAEDMLTMPEEL